MIQQLNSVSDHDSPLPPVVEAVSLAGTDFGTLLLRYSELSRDVARLRDLLEAIAERVAAPPIGKRLPSKISSRKVTKRPDFNRQPTARRSSRRPPKQGGNTRPVRSRLERACVIALMETSDPAPVEVIYDRVERRGSFTFAGYKHPFRAIVLAMGAMVRRGEAVLSNEEGRRRWRWEPERVPLEHPTSLPLA
jgi:hypothetical protein